MSEFPSLVLLLVGGVVLLLASQPPRADFRARLRILDGGVTRPTLRQVRQAVSAGLRLALIPASPVVLWALDLPLVASAAVAVALLPTMCLVVVELYAGLRRRIPGRVPLTTTWQRRVVGTLVTRVMAPFPAPPMGRRRAAIRRRPVLDVPGEDRLRLLIVPPDRRPTRLADLAEAYLGSLHRYREILALNFARLTPAGDPITEATPIEAGWTLVMPPDAVGEGLVDLPDSSPRGFAALPAPPPPRPAPGEPAASRPTSPERLAERPSPAPHDPAALPPPDWEVVGAAPARTVVIDVTDLVAASSDAGPPAAPDPEAGVASEASADRVLEDPDALEETTARVSGPSGGEPDVPLTSPPDVSLVLPSPVLVPATSPESVRYPAAGFPPAELPWELVHAGFLADGVRTAVAVRRLQSQYDRPVGAEALPLDTSSAAVLMATELGADTAGARDLDSALRVFGREGTPTVLAARVLPGAVHVVLAPGETVPAIPDGGRVWTIDRPVQSGTSRLEGAAVTSLPGLVSLGRDAKGWILVNLLAAPGPVGVLGEPHAARLVVLAMALELVTKRWADGVGVLLVGFGLSLNRLDPRLTTAAHVDDAVSALRRPVADRGTSGPRRPDPRIVVLAAPPTAAECDRLLDAVGELAPGGAALVAAGGTDRDAWTFVVDDGILRSVQDPTIVVGAQAVSDATAEGIARLARVEERTVLADLGPGRPTPPPMPSVVDVDRMEVMVRLFGRVGLHAPEGEVPADSKVVEILAFLALFGPATREEVARMVFPRGVDGDVLERHLARTSDAIAGANGDTPRMSVDGDGRIAVSEEVLTDWQAFVSLYRAGRVEAALDLLQAAEFPDGPMDMLSHFPWLAVVPLARAMPGFVADVVHEAARAFLDRAHPDGASWAASLGLRSLPSNQVLRDDLEAALRAVRERYLLAASGWA
jgi:hypothetical protein